MRVVFFGTPPAAAPSLRALIESKHELAGVVTAPDKPKGRGMKMESPVIKQMAEEAGLPVLQFRTLKVEESQEALRGLRADVFVVVAYGFILPAAVLEIPRLGCINVHFSLLPALRGAGPVQWALIQGHSVTGVTIMQMDEGMDTGPILDTVETPIGRNDNTESVEARLAEVGAELLLDILARLEAGKIDPRPQDESLATYAPKISSEDARIDWSAPADMLLNRIRGMTPRPGAWTMLGGKRLKIWEASVHSESSGQAPGTAVIDEGRLKVQTGTSLIELEQVQPEGKSRMAAAEFVRGYRPLTGDRLG